VNSIPAPCGRPRLPHLLPALLLLLSLAGCRPGTQTGSVVVLRAATNNTIDSGHYAGLLIFKRLVEERTGGQVRVVLYSDGVLGDEEEMIEGMKMGTVHAMMAAAAKYANFVPEMDLYSMPYLFTGWPHYKAVMRSEVDEHIRQAVREQTGDFYAGCFTDGVRNVFTRQPVPSLEALQGLKLRTMTGPNEVRAWKALGTHPTPLAYTELYAALQAGVVDGAENTMTSLLTMRFHESCKYVLRTQHNFLALPFFVSAKALEKVPEPWRDTIRQAARDACAEQVDSAICLDQDNEQVLKEQHRVEVFEFADTDAGRARAACEPVLRSNAERIGMAADYDLIRKLAMALEQTATP